MSERCHATESRSRRKPRRALVSSPLALELATHKQFACGGLGTVPSSALCEVSSISQPWHLAASIYGPTGSRARGANFSLPRRAWNGPSPPELVGSEILR